MSSKKNIGLVIVVLVIGYNIYDYFKVKHTLLSAEIEKCSNKYTAAYSDLDKKVADKFCACLLENLGEKYKNSNTGAENIIEKEKLVLQDCFEKAKR